MSEFNRRGFLTGAVPFAAGVTSTGHARAGDAGFMNNFPDPLLSQKELPTFKSALEKSKPGRVIGKNTAREASVQQLPISKGIAGVSMELAPGGMRELHWHPTADEWQYVFEGQVSVTLFGANRRYRIETLEKGNLGYIPPGYGHSLENAGDKPALLFDKFPHRDVFITPKEGPEK